MMTDEQQAPKLAGVLPTTGALVGQTFSAQSDESPSDRLLSRHRSERRQGKEGTTVDILQFIAVYNKRTYSFSK